MKSLKLFGTFVLLAASLAACDPIQGTLQVLQPFTAKSGQPSKPCPDYEYPCMAPPEETITVPAGSHSMKIEMFGGDLAQIRLKIGRDEKILELKMPRGSEIPDTGAFSLPSHQTGQPFDLNGQTQTTVSTTDETRTQETCQVPVQEYTCGVRGNPPKYQCWYETRYRSGYQDVAYYFRTTHQDMSAQLLQSGTTVAQFQGSRQSTDKIYTYKSSCYIRGF